MLFLVPLPFKTRAACCSDSLPPLLLLLPSPAPAPAVAVVMWFSSAARLSKLARVLAAFFLFLVTPWGSVKEEGKEGGSVVLRGWEEAEDKRCDENTAMIVVVVLLLLLQCCCPGSTGIVPPPTLATQQGCQEDTAEIRHVGYMLASNHARTCGVLGVLLCAWTFS